MTYTVDRVLEIMKMYSVYKQAIRDSQPEYASRGVAIISDMPGANSISDVVADEAMKNVEGLKVIAEMKTDCKYIEDRLCRVSYDHEEILYKRLEGCNTETIAYDVGMSSRSVRRRLNAIACEIVCP